MPKDRQTNEDPRKKTENEKETQEPQETQETKEKKETTRKNEKRTYTKRKRENTTQEVRKLSTETPNTGPSHICTKITHIPSHTNVIDVIKSGFGTKQTKSKLIQKPVFKSRKKNQPTAKSTI